MTYLQLNGIFLVAVLALTLLALRGTRSAGAGRGRWWARSLVVFLVLAVFTVVFDSIMIWADLFRFDDEHMSGLRIGLAPVEDLAWPLAAALLLPALWTWPGRNDTPSGTTTSGTTTPEDPA
ncbi:lycopene cyclase domain-containing protein [Sanguibacter antarcticus]|uniref:Lycopene cyclase domain-containing protein n=1 Tax=Sanguibacter antarcticus TaxID=372484 RepID=A0A2A9E3H9_9MICO|nr:lycopene cyclase domain-containing protein [Sanguibacter antarcticus]PFG32759.1 lycopene cyclase domain-containing protein [Sanguibacter antarcticus]